MNEKYEPIKFDSWQELAKYVIDGGEVYFKAFQNKYLKVTFNGTQFDTNLDILHKDRELFIKKQPTLEELIAIKPRLCWVWDNHEEYHYIRIITAIINNNNTRNFISLDGEIWDNAQTLTDDEIKQFLSGE